MMKRFIIGLVTVGLIGFVAVAVFGRTVVDYKSNEELITAIENKEDVIGKTVKVEVHDLTEMNGELSRFRPNNKQNIWYLSKKQGHIVNGDKLVIEVKHVNPIGYGGYIIGYK